MGAVENVMKDAATDVLIVGAGPTGLTLACALAQRDVPVRVIDAASEPATGSRGKGLQPRTLELFDDLGIVDSVVAHGRFGLPTRYYDERGRSKDDRLHEQRSPQPDTPFQQPLITPQWRVEEALRQKLAQLGVRVEFGVRLTNIRQDDGGVTAELCGSGPMSVEARWLVGCDGGKSSVRQLIGVSFLGETLETHRMLVGDVHVQGIDRDHWHIWKSADGFLALCPLPSTDAFQFQASIAPGQESETSLEVLQQIADRRTGHGGIRLSEPTWMSLWRANVRMVDRYRRNRVFLAGDAAHVHSPAGGQGMNTGIQDAYNLGWKLAAVQSGADAALLDTYQEERLPIAAGVLGISNEIMRSTVAAGTILFRRDERTLQLDLNYRPSKLSKETRPDGDGLRAGDRAPDAPGLKGPNGSSRMFDLLRGPHATILGFGSQWQPVIDECTGKFKESLRGYVIVPGPEAGGGSSTHYLDADGHARAGYGERSLYIVRPDNYVGMATLGLDSSPVIEYLQHISPRASR
jgi:2-polyprenyl-6-methoxyphenol hydroxylase-like FAD-dependent oxidoreductase